MLRDKGLDNIFLKNFMKNSVGFFNNTQPTEDAYMDGYALASHQWLCLKAELDTYHLSNSVKNQLIKLFELAENYFYYVNSSNYPYRSEFMVQKWAEMKCLAGSTINLACLS